MKSFIKLILLIGSLTLVFGYGLFQTFAMNGGSNLSCDERPGFEDKIIRIKEICTRKIALLNKVDSSLQEILPLVKNPTVNKSLAQQQNLVQIMKKNYTTLKSRIEKNSKTVCGKDPVWKSYNEDTKLLVENIRKQFRLLKK